MQTNEAQPTFLNSLEFRLQVYTTPAFTWHSQEELLRAARAPQLPGFSDTDLARLNRGKEVVNV